MCDAGAPKVAALARCSPVGQKLTLRLALLRPSPAHPGAGGGVLGVAACPSGVLASPLHRGFEPVGGRRRAARAVSARGRPFAGIPALEPLSGGAA